MFSDTQEKQFIRERLWKPVIEETCSRKGIVAPRYLCFPGGACLELRFLRDECKKGLDNVSAVEKDETDAAAIEYFLQSKGKVFTGDFGALLNQNVKFKKTFEKPYDLINLDFYGSANLLGILGGSKSIELVQKVLEFQSKGGATDFSLLLTFKAKEALKGSKEIFDYWRARGLSNFERLESDISGRTPSANVHKAVSMIALQLGHIAGEFNFKGQLIMPPFLYRGNHGTDGYQRKKTQMVALGFRIEKVKNSKISSPGKVEKEQKLAQTATVSELLKIQKVAMKKG
jgi:hypothetical protein